MTDSFCHTLKWVIPDVPDVPVVATVAANVGAGAAASINIQNQMEQTLHTVGLPIGSTKQAQSSPLLEARDLLRAAAEIEHGLLVQYLYAAYSCTKLAIRGTIAQIAREEMGHLISVQNMILSIGGHPYFGRDEFPTDLQPGVIFPFPMTFEPLSLGSLAKYIVAESPPLSNITDPSLKARVQPVINAANVAAQQSINHVGAIYLALYWLFKKDDLSPTEWPNYPTAAVIALHQKLGRTDWHIRDDNFAKKEDFDDVQADTDKPGDDWNKGDTRIFVRHIGFSATGQADRAGILETLFLIADQGEGWEMSPTATQKSHFLRFLETYEAIALMPLGPPLAFHIPINPSTVVPTAGGFIANPEANLWGQIFNVRYRVAIIKLALSMASRRSLDDGKVDGRSALISDAIENEMKSNLKIIALQLIQMRRKGVPTDGPELERAAPPFELPAGSLPNLVGLDPDPKVAEAKAIKMLRRALKDALEDMADLVNRVSALPQTLLDSPAPRELLSNIVKADAALRTALG